jgi:hypothetical protein
MPQTPLMVRKPPSMVMTGRMLAGNKQVMLAAASGKWQRQFLFVNNPPAKEPTTIYMRRAF